MIKGNVSLQNQNDTKQRVNNKAAQAIQVFFSFSKSSFKKDNLQVLFSS